LILACIRELHYIKLLFRAADAPIVVQGWYDYLNSALQYTASTAAQYLPKSVAEVITQERAFAMARLPYTQRNVCAITT